MKKTCKRLGAIFLAMAMAVSVLCTGAMADDAYSITISNTTAGYTYEAYQVFAGTLGAKAEDATEASLGITDWGTNLKGKESTLIDALKVDTTIGTDFTNVLKKGNTAGGATIEATSVEAAQNVAAAIKGYDNDSAKAKAFAKIVAANVTGNAAGSANTVTDTKGYVIGLKSAGYYIVKNTVAPSGDTDENAAYSNYILKVVGNEKIDPKSSVPEVTKKIVEGNNEKDATTANIGDTVTFKLTATLPNNYADYSNYELTFHDLLSAGLTLDENSITVTAKSKTENSSEITLEKGANYTVKTGSLTSENDSTKCNLEVAINNMKTNDQLKNLPAGSTITVTYTAKLNANANLGTAEGGNSNKVKLEYSNNPNDTDKKGTTPEDEVKVYTFQMNVVKKDGDGENANALSGAKFVLATKQLTKTEDQTTTDVNVITTSDIETYKTNLVGVNGSSPTYTVGGTTYEMEVSNTEATKGQLNIKGLKAGTYYLYETVAPDGYNKLTKPIKIEITAGEDTKSVDGKEIKTLNGKVSAKVDDNTTIGEVENGILDKVTVVNNAGSQLPSTGGMGTTLFYVIGGALMAGAAIVLVIKKKRSSAE